MKPPKPILSTHRWLNQPDHLAGPYNAWDTYNTARLVPKQTSMLEKTGRLEFFNKWFSEMVPVVMDMQRRGIGQLDMGRKEQMRRRVRRELKEIEDGILGQVTRFTDARSAADWWTLNHYLCRWGRAPVQRSRGHASRHRKVNEREEKFFNASKDLRGYLFDDLGLQPAPTTHQRTERSVGQEALLYVLNHLRKRDLPHLPILHDLFHRSRLHTIDIRYLTVEAWADGQVRPTIKLAGTKTLRLAYSEPPLQQWPKEIRDIIVPRPGFVYVARDYSQIEARILAELAGDDRSREAFSRGLDIHTENAKDLFGYSDEQWNGLPPIKRTEVRNYAKSFLYRISYGGQADSDNQKLYCPCPRCVDSVPPMASLPKTVQSQAGGRWFRLHPAVVDFRSSLKESVVKGDRTYTSPWGWNRTFLQIGPELDRELYNFPMQHGAAMIVNDAMVKLHAKGVPLVLQMHDELVAEVPEKHAQDTLDLMGEIMEAPVPELGGLSFPTEPSMGDDWGEL